MRADVLAIFDCCYASNVKGCQDSRRLYDLLAACPEGKPTKAPGKNSFSQRLVDTLNEMLNEDPDQRILTTRIMDEMNKECRFPIKLHDRLHKGKSDGRHVQLVRINDGSRKKTQNAVKRFQKVLSEEARVTLRFSLYDANLSQGQIEKWAGYLVTASNSTRASIPLRQIEWVRMEKGPGGRWRDAIGHVIKNHPAQRFRDTVETAIKTNTGESIQQDTRKRSQPHQGSTALKRQAQGLHLTPKNRPSPRFMTPESNTGP